MAYGMSFDTGIPANYQTGLYWQYLMQAMQQAQQMQQAQYKNAAALFEKNNNVSQTTPNTEIESNTPVDSLAVSSQAPVQEIVTNGDGKDDGKISAGKKVKNFFKGVGNFFKGMVCDENGKFSITRTLTTVGIAAGAVALTVATGGAATPFLIAGGAALGAIQAGKGIYKAATAKTDAEAEAAWQEIGSGTTAVVGAVAGAKGALKSAGVSAPKGTGIKGSIKALKDCTEIAGKGVYNAGKYAFTHSPVKTANVVKGYYTNTMKPNLAEAFSFKNGYKNYMENKQHVTNKQEKMAAWEEQITKVEKELNNPAINASERARLTQLRENLYEAYRNEDVHFRANFNKNIQNREQYIAKLKDKLATATKENKQSINAEIKLNQQILKTMKNQQKVEFAQHNIDRANADITNLKLQLKKANITEAETKAINARISKIESAIAKDKAVLRNSNMKIAAQQTLPKAGIAYGAFYLSNPQAQVELGLGNIEEADAYAQSQGFESAAAMQEYINNQIQQNEKEIAQYNQSQAASQMQTSQQVTNPYGYGMNIPLPYMNMESGLDFNALYQSPYPQYYF